MKIHITTNLAKVQLLMKSSIVLLFGIHKEMTFPFPIYVSLRSGLTSYLYLMFLVFAGCDGAPEKIDNDNRPNILILVADDLGYSDLGCFGGEINTPNIDTLALNGIRFSRFHTAPMCAPTRAMLLTGNDNHIAGVGRQAIQADVFGYEGQITKRVATIPDLLRKDGYKTFMAGKWHLGQSKEANPDALGFEHSFVLLEGVGNHFNSEGIFGDNSESHYTQDGQQVQWPEGEYSTDVYTDKILSLINDDEQDKRPFFAYAAYTAPHWPLQVDKKYWGKYEGMYDAGYEKLRQQRFEQLQTQGLIPESSVLPPLHPSIKPWESLNEDEKKKESRKMELYAGMLDNLDANIGRIISSLKASGKYDNTLIIFLSDNGAAGEDYYNNSNIRPYINNYYTNHYDKMGSPESFISYGPQWAEAGSAPFKYYKEYTTNGGIIAPMIISGALVKDKSTLESIFVSVMDIAPTIYSFSGTTYPSNWNGRRIYPLMGKSMYSFLSGNSETVHSDDDVFALEHTGYTMLRKGHWKITNTIRPFDESNFELYDLSNDLGETHDLKFTSSVKYKELLSEWEKFSRDVRLQLPR